MKIVLHPVTEKRLNALLVEPPHAIALRANNGSGKGYLSLYLASKLLRKDVGKLQNEPYLIHHDAESPGYGIDSIRDIQTTLSMKVPSSEAYNRVVIIEHFDNLGHEGQNALLKTLEEPPSGTVIIVTYAHAKNVLPTIASRVQSVELVSPTLNQLLQDVISVDNKEEIKQNYHMSEGRMGLFFALQNSDNESHVSTLLLAKKLLTLSRYDRLCQVDSLIKQTDLSVSYLIECMRLIVSSALHISVMLNKLAEINLSIARLNIIESAIDDLSNGVQSKVVLSRVFAKV